MKNRQLIFLMFLAMLSWGVAWTNAKIVNEYLSYTNLVFLRYLSSFLCLVPILYLRKKKFVLPDTLTLVSISAVSGLYYFYNIFFFHGTDIGDAGFGGVFVTTTNPIVTFVLISILSKKINRVQLAGIFVGFIGGCVILDVSQNGVGSFMVAENVSFIACSLSWGLITVIMSHGQKNYDSLSYIILCYLFTVIISVFFIDSNQLLTLSIYDIRFFVNFFFVSIGAMTFGTSVYMYTAPRLGPVETSVFIFLVPFIAMFTAFIILDEPVTLNVVVGGLLSLLAIYLINSYRLDAQKQ